MGTGPAQISSCLHVCLGTDVGKDWAHVASSWNPPHQSTLGSASFVPCLPHLHSFTSLRNHSPRGAGQTLAHRKHRWTVDSPAAQGPSWPEIHTF